MDTAVNGRLGKSVATAWINVEQHACGCRFEDLGGPLFVGERSLCPALCPLAHAHHCGEEICSEIPSGRTDRLPRFKFIEPGSHLLHKTTCRTPPLALCWSCSINSQRMIRIRPIIIVISLLAAVAAFTAVRTASSADPLPGFPRVVLWAWERPEDLRFMTAGSAGIAFLAKTVWVDGNRVWARPRLQPLRFTPGTPLMAVVRIESRGRGLPPREAVIRELLHTVELRDIRALQIDFDARESERRWYEALLVEAREKLPASLPLTITALASWCESDSWIRDLPVADASPMLFRMGPDERVPTSDFDVQICRSSIGVSTDELPRRLPYGRRLYFFHNSRWTPEAYQGVLAQARRWQ